MGFLALLGSAINGIGLATRGVDTAWRRYQHRADPQVQLELVGEGVPVAQLNKDKSVDLTAWVRFRITNPTGDEARLHNPCLVWSAVRPLGRRQALTELMPIAVDGAPRAFQEIVPPYEEGEFQTICFHRRWWSMDGYPRNSELVLRARVLVPQRRGILIARWRNQTWAWPGSYEATWTAWQHRKDIL